MILKRVLNFTAVYVHLCFNNPNYVHITIDFFFSAVYHKFNVYGYLSQLLYMHSTVHATAVVAAFK